MKPSSTFEANGSAVIVGSGLAGKKRTGVRNTGDSGASFLKSRPVNRSLALLAVLLATVGVMFGLVRELSVGSTNTHFIAMLAIPSLLVAAATAVALPKQDESYRPLWSVISYLVVIGALAFVPVVTAWSGQMGFGASPAIVPALACLVCVVAPLAIPNQLALGLGSAIPKVLILVWAMHFTDSSSLGITAGNYIISPQSALVALAFVTAAMSLFMMFFRYRMPAWMMFLIGLIAMVPCICKLEFCMVHAGFM